jgi:hypothetical protein
MSPPGKVYIKAAGKGFFGRSEKIEKKPPLGGWRR